MSPPTRKIVFHVPSLLPDEGDKRAADAPPERGDSSLLAPTAPTEPSGDGDVHVWPCLSSCGEAVVIVELCSPVGETLLQFPSRAVQEFVYSSVEAVAMGAEQVDVDAWLDQLLAG